MVRKAAASTLQENAEMRNTTPARNAGVRQSATSWWLDEVRTGQERRPRLERSGDADVCIVGGGYTGLWTALELKRAAPELAIVILEREFVGYGASGRNGGWVYPDVSGKREEWVRRGGINGLRAMHSAIEATVDEIAAAIEREGIECDFVKGGALRIAEDEYELRRLVDGLEADRKWGLVSPDTRLLTAAELRDRVGVRRGLAAQFRDQAARVQPAKLAQGLGRAAERAGVTIHESTPVIRLRPGRAETPHGDVTARWVVRATEAYSSELPGLRRLMVPVNSVMVVTHPLGRDVWERLAWEGQETIQSGLRMYNYIQRTADGRIAIGRPGLRYRLGSATNTDRPIPLEIVQALRRDLGRLLGLGDTPLSTVWQGVFGLPRSMAPSVGIDERGSLAWAGGYGGEGVAAANLAARTLKDLILGEDSHLTRLPWVGRPGRRWEPEPIRFAGIRLGDATIRAADWWERKTGRPSVVGRLADRVMPI
jgi:glycine/D-amino acid oxidase-like deaminating enzyme